MSRVLIVASLISCLLLSPFLHSQNIDYGKEVVKILSSPEFSGRGYVDAGVHRAADYLVKEFRNNGTEPLNADYRQEFSVNVNTFPGRMGLSIDGDVFKAGEEFIIDPASPSLKGRFGVQYIQVEELLKTSKFRRFIKSGENKVLVVDERGYSSEDKEEKTLISERLKQIKYSPEIKRRATIILTDKKLTWHIASMQIVSPVFIVKTSFEIKNTSLVEVDIEAEFKENYKTCNIAGIQLGTANTDSVIVLTAHYDHLGKMGEEVFIPGANDNASGVAMILTLSRYFKNNPARYPIVYLATSAEELGLVGAKHFVEHSEFDLSKIKFLLNFDLAGTGDEGIKVVNGSIFRDEFDRLADINGRKEYLPAVKIRGEACNSDHCMFYMKGVPCFFLYTLGGIQAYHDVNDKFETLPFTEFDDYSKLMIDFIQGFE